MRSRVSFFLSDFSIIYILYLGSMVESTSVFSFSW